VLSTPLVVLVVLPVLLVVELVLLRLALLLRPCYSGAIPVVVSRNAHSDCNY